MLLKAHCFFFFFFFFLGVAACSPFHLGARPKSSKPHGTAAQPTWSPGIHLTLHGKRKEPTQSGYLTSPLRDCYGSHATAIGGFQETFEIAGMPPPPMGKLQRSGSHAIGTSAEASVATPAPSVLPLKLWHVTLEQWSCSILGAGVPLGGFVALFVLNRHLSVVCVVFQQMAHLGYLSLHRVGWLPVLPLLYSDS